MATMAATTTRLFPLLRGSRRAYFLTSFVPGSRNPYLAASDAPFGPPSAPSPPPKTMGRSYPRLRKPGGVAVGTGEQEKHNGPSFSVRFAHGRSSGKAKLRAAVPGPRIRGPPSLGPHLSALHLRTKRSPGPPNCRPWLALNQR
jgi:hypothetical protein